MSAVHQNRPSSIDPLRHWSALGEVARQGVGLQCPSLSRPLGGKQVLYNWASTLGSITYRQNPQRSARGFPMWQHPPSPRSKLVGIVGIYVLLLGAFYTYFAYAYALFVVAPFGRTDILGLALSFAPAAVLCTLGIGLILHNRWAFVGYFVLTAIVLVAGMPELTDILFRTMSATEFHFIVIRTMGLLVTLGIPASLLWTRRDCFRSPFKT